MKRTGKCRWFQFIVIFAASACVGKLMAARVQRVRDWAEVTNMMGNKKTLCVGHFLVEVPEQAETGLSGQIIRGFGIDTHVMTGSSFMSEACCFTDDMLQSYRMLSVETGTNRRPGSQPFDTSFHQDTELPLQNDISSLIRLQKAGTKPVGTESIQISLSCQACLQSGNTVCSSDEVMFDFPRLDDNAAFKRQFVLSSRRNPFAKPVSTLL